MMSVNYDKDLIYDVGLHKGEDSEFYLKKGFRVVAIEALPALARAATERLRAYVDGGQLTIVNVAIAEKDGRLTFFECSDYSGCGTSSPDWAVYNRRLGATVIETTVQGVNFANILREYGIPYYLKVDIEGADTLCLDALNGFQSKPKYVSIEASKTSWRDVRREFALLTGLGYSKFKVVGQHLTKTQTCPFPAKEGRYVDHRFGDFASGLFGEEAPGEWMSKAKAIWAYRFIFLQYKLFARGGLTHRSALARRLLRRFERPIGWYDTHAAA